MISQGTTRAKQSLLRELDRNFQQYFHTNLHEVIHELRVHHVDITSDPAPDELIQVIDQSRILDFVDAPTMLELRDTVHRVREGTFGVCVACKRRISAQTLEVEPNAKLCRSCSRRVVRSGLA